MILYMELGLTNQGEYYKKKVFSFDIHVISRSCFPLLVEIFNGRLMDTDTQQNTGRILRIVMLQFFKFLRINKKKEDPKFHQRIDSTTDR